MSGYATPEAAALDPGVPSRFRRLVGVTVEGDRAVVYTLLNDRPPFEEYSDYCRLKDGRWFSTHGSGGWDSPPPDVVEAVRTFGHEH